MKTRTLLAYLLIGIATAWLPRQASALSFTALPTVTTNPILYETLSPNGTTVQFTIDAPATVTATFYYVAGDGSLTAMDSVSQVFGTSGAKTLYWDALFLLGFDLGRYSGNYQYRLTATDGTTSIDSGFSTIPIVIDSLDITIASASFAVDSSGNGTAPFQIIYYLAKEARMNITIEDSSGTVVRTLANNALKSVTPNGATGHIMVWDGLKDSGTPADIGIYTLRMTATNSNGDSAIPRTRTLTLGSLAGVSTNAKKLFEENAYVHPNPIRAGQGLFRIQTIRNNAKTTIKIYTLTGDLVRTQEFTGRNSGDVIDWPWDVKNDSGNKVGRGLYYGVIREESPDGTLQTVEKVAVIE